MESTFFHGSKKDVHEMESKKIDPVHHLARDVASLTNLEQDL